MDPNWTQNEKAWRPIHKMSASYIEQALEVTPK